MLTIKQLEALSTKRLLAYKQTLQSPCIALTHEERYGEIDLIKSVLSTREHVVRAGKEEESARKRARDAYRKKYSLNKRSTK